MWAEPAIQILYRNVEEIIKSELSLLLNAKSELEKLSSYLQAIQAVLADAETKQNSSRAVELWLERLKDAAHDADDILSDWETLEARLRLPVNSNNKLLDFLSSLKKKAKRTMPLRRVAKKIKKITKRFEHIAKEKSDLNLSEGVAVPAAHPKHRETSLVPIEDKIYGRDADVKNIVDLLLENLNNAHDDVSVIPILGMCGVGKTTLAQFVCKDKRVIQHFEDRLYWCWLPDDFDAKVMLRRFLEDITRTPCALDNLNAIQRELHERLNGKRFLLVLDDVWTGSQELWSMIKSYMQSFAKGSSIIITTRLRAVADNAGTSPAYELPLLSNQDCSLLFQSYAFKNTGNQVNSRLEEIGQQIVVNCGGLPLAARVLGDLLRSKDKERDKERQWELTRDGENSDLQEHVRLSYRCLLLHAKHCFSHCSLFPKGPEIEKHDLIHMWMANKLLPVDEMMGYEDQGEEIFTELLGHSMLIGTRDDDGKPIVKCKIHNILHGLASSILKNHRSQIVADVEPNLNIPKKVRHLSVMGINQSSDFSVSPFTSLRTLHLTRVKLSMLPAGNLKHLRCLSLESCGLERLPKNFFRKLRNLQMLSLANSDLQVLPSSIGDLENLRYLNLSRNPKIKSLPESIGGLKRLQRLKSLHISFCDKLASLPHELLRLTSLESLKICNCPSLTSLPAMGMKGQMSYLRSLHIVECVILESQFEGLQHLTTLESFQLSNCPNSQFSAQDLEHLTALNYLRVDPPIDLPESVKARLAAFN